MDRRGKRPAEWEDPIGNTKVRRLNSTSELGRSQDSTEIDQDIKFRYNSVVKGSPHYFTMIVCMILSVGTSVYRNVLKRKMPNIKNFEKELLSLEPWLNNHQKSILFPEKGTFSGDLNKLNMETIYIILKEKGDFKPHSKGWGVLPEDDDHSTSANLDRIELIRAKTIGRCANTNIEESEFKTICSILINAIIELGASIERLCYILHNKTYTEPQRKGQKQTGKLSSENRSSRNEKGNLKRKNYFLILRLTLDIGTRVLREEFESRFPKNRSFGQIFKIYKSDLKPKLDKTSRKIIYPKEGKYTGNLRDLAIPTLYSLCRCAANIQPHDQGWGNPPNEDDRSLSANIERIRIIRNEIVSYPECKMDEAEYKMKLRSLKQTLLGLGAKEKDINDIIDISSGQQLRYTSKVDKWSDEQTDESTQFWGKSSNQRKEWFFKLPIVCDELVVDCIIDKRLQHNYKSLEKIIKKRELSIMSGRPPGVCDQIFETEQIDMQHFIHACEFLYDSMDRIRLLKDFTVLYLPSNVEFEKIFIFQKVMTSRKVNIKGELHNSIESNQIVLCRHILINFNKSVMCPLLQEALDKAIKTKRRNTMKAMTSQIIKYFFQIHEKVFDRLTSIWLGIECTCETSKVVSYEDCLYSSSKPKIIIERYPSHFKETFEDKMFYGFSIRIIETNSKEARFVANQIFQNSGTQLIEGNISGKVAKDLFGKHSNLSIIYPSSMKSKGFKNTGSHKIENLNCINLVCTVKGVIPVGDTHFPLEIEGVETDVLEGATHLLGSFRIGDVVEKMNAQSCGTLGGFVKYYGLDTFLTCAHVVFGADIVHSITKNKIHLEKCHMMTDKNISDITECILIRHTFKHDDHNPSETSIDAALAVINGGDLNMFNIANDDRRRQCCTDLGLSSPYLNNNAIDPVTLRNAKAFCGISGNQMCDLKTEKKNILVRTGTHIQSRGIKMYNQLCIYGMEFHEGDSGTCVYVHTSGYKRLTGCIGMLIGKSTCENYVLTPMKEILKIFDL
ncbi:uncharacterized protein LOC127723528 [Mytilus californianus]|uniref:uncharacterized protein LOC127723528 n=1 Tax=Mytilus californianus TaxID=6549 RepID=UPI002245BBA4|nr:uncharacterized protein LOC127723528 [Mytilus californianus]